MDSTTAARLLDLNRQFYQTFGREFSVTRGRIQPGVRRILGTLTGNESILDLGCGNGELARELARRGHSGAYTGLDFSLPLLEAAGCQPEGFAVKFLQTDLSSPDWDFSLPTSSFGIVFAFAVLHHLPGADLRLGILNKAHNLLADGGQFVHSEWQFLNSEKLRKRIQPWEAVSLSAADVDAGDYLLDWRGGGCGLRYVHAFDEMECNTLAAAGGFEVRETFYSDGEGGKSGLYQIWHKP